MSIHEVESDIDFRDFCDCKTGTRLSTQTGDKMVTEVTSNTTSTNDKCLIFDDTDIEKSGKKIEGVSKIYNHVTKTFVLGYKLLVAEYWNGSVFIPVDFSFHRENRNN